jgi:hypothetical protein
MTTRPRTAASIYCLALCGYLRADIIVDYTFTSDCTQMSCAPLSIPQFNPALGSLNSITLSLFATFSGSVTYQNNSGTTGLFDTQFYNELLLPGVINTQTNTIDLFGEVFPDSSTISQYALQSTSNFLLSDDFQPYIGTGTLNVHGGSGVTFEGEDHDPNLSGPFPGQPSTDYTLGVEYNYSFNSEGQAPAPEPASLALFGAGTALFVLARKKLHDSQGRRGRN